ncbi:hypothetical protein GOV05_00210 [Candidatus Woesearchaeota archaeon]|nr:hypothetical protein [Candidatus Woesearchaeota archaeon]
MNQPFDTLVDAEYAGLEKDSVVRRIAPIIIEEDLSRVILVDEKHNRIHVANLSENVRLSSQNSEVQDFWGMKGFDTKHILSTEYYDGLIHSVIFAKPVAKREGLVKDKDMFYSHTCELDGSKSKSYMIGLTTKSLTEGLITPVIGLAKVNGDLWGTTVFSRPADGLARTYPVITKYNPENKDFGLLSGDISSHIEKLDLADENTALELRLTNVGNNVGAFLKTRPTREDASYKEAEYLLIFKDDLECCKYINLEALTDYDIKNNFGTRLYAVRDGELAVFRFDNGIFEGEKGLDADYVKDNMSTKRVFNDQIVNSGMPTVSENHIIIPINDKDKGPKLGIYNKTKINNSSVFVLKANS